MRRWTVAAVVGAVVVAALAAAPWAGASAGAGAGVGAGVTPGGAGWSIPGPAYVLRAGSPAATERAAEAAPAPRGEPARFALSFGASVPTAARTAVQAAADHWAPLLASPVPISVTVTWSPLGTGVLGWGASLALSRDFSGAPRANTFYPSALANALHGSDLFPAQADISITLNSSFSAWYMGTAGTPPAGRWDLVTVAMHELAHGLGFLTSMEVSGGVGRYGFGYGSPTAYDRTLESASGQNLVATYASGSSALAAQLTSTAVYQGGTWAVTAARGVRPRLWAPSSWTAGSIAHLSEGTYPASDPHAMMTPTIAAAEVHHAPGTIALGILRDSGWVLNVPIGAGVAIGNRTVTEGDTGTLTMSFTVTLSLAPAGPVSVRWATADGTAVSPGDYRGASGTVSFATGQATRTVTVAAVGDVVDEADETFTIRLSEPVHLRMVDGTGVGTIADDD
jgi:Calx-beta domain